MLGVTISSFFQKHRKKKITALILICIAVIAITVLSGREGGIPVNTGEVIVSAFEQNVFATGKLEVKDKHEFFAKSNTTVEDITVKTGEAVTKGQVILRTDDGSLAVEASRNRLTCDDIRARIISSESNIRLYRQDYDSAIKDYEQADILYANGAVSRKELEAAGKKVTEAREKLVVERDANLPLLKAQLVQAETVYDQSEELLKEATVVSPIDGVVLNLPVKKGQEVDIGDLLVQIGDPRNLQIETGINEIDGAQLKVGNQAQISNNALLDKPLSGFVEYLSPIAETVQTSQGEQNQMKIRIALDSAEGIGNLKPGFNVNLKIILHKKEEALLVPYEAVMEKEGKEVAFVVSREGIAGEREVQTGLSNELYREVISGLKEGERVILNPDEKIKGGMKVKVDAAGQ